MTRNFRAFAAGLRASVLLLCSLQLAAAPVPAKPSLDGATGPGTHETLVERVRQAQESEYSTVMALLDAYLATHPDDVTMAVERCRFIDYVGSSEDIYIEAAGEALESCSQALQARGDADSAAIRLYLLEQLWGEPAIAEANDLLAESSAWTKQEQARLHERLAILHAPTDVIRAGQSATRAIRLDPDSSVRTIAAEYSIRIGDKATALRILQETPDDGWLPGHLDDAVRLLVGMHAAKAAHTLLQAHPDQFVGQHSRVLLARGLYDEGQTELARALVMSTERPDPTAPYVSLPNFRELFELERDHGTLDSAATAYRALRDTGLRGDPFGRHRLSLLLTHPRAAWRLGDSLGFGVLLLLLGVIAMMPAIVVVPVHYRSVVNRLRNLDPRPETSAAPWSLRHVWYALAAPLVIGLLAVYFLDYQSFHQWLGVTLGFADQYDVVTSDIQLGNAAFAASAVTLLVLLPLLSRVGWRPLLLGQWSIWKSLLAGFGLALLVLFVSRVLTILWNRLGHDAGALGSDTVRSLQGIHASYGALVMMLYIAVLVPIVEEVVFRGVVLRTLSRYLTVWAVVILQAAAFMLLHEEAASYPFIFLLALVAAWLAIRSGGLLAPIMLHATNNAFAGLSVVALDTAFHTLR